MITYCVYRSRDIEYHEPIVLELDYSLRIGDKIEIDSKIWEVTDVCVMGRDNFVTIKCKYIKTIDKLF